MKTPGLGKSLFLFLFMLAILSVSGPIWSNMGVPDIHLYCRSLLTQVYSEKIEGNSQKTRKVIEFANRLFLRRGWPPEFLEERFRVAEKYKNRSEYAIVKRAQNSKKILGTLGLTTARYSQGLPESELELLPLEETLNIVPLKRPKGKNGKGTVFEFRTYAIDKPLNKLTFTALVREI